MKTKMTRRDFFGTSGAGLTGVALTGPTKTVSIPDQEKDQSSSQPHVLLIYGDEHRFDCLGVMGNRDVQTPHLDQLTSDGALFRNSFCAWPVCTPSRYSLLTGLNVRQHRGLTNRSTLQQGIPTFPEMLSSADSATEAIGKMHFTPVYLDVGFGSLTLSEQNGRGRLVDEYHRYLENLDLIDAIDLIDQVRSYRDQAPREYWETFGAGRSNLPGEHHSTTWIGNQAVKALSKWTAAQPAVLMVGFIKPHHPFDPPEPWDKMYDPRELSMLPGWTDRALSRDINYKHGYFDHTKLTASTIRRVMQHYYATISHIDAQVGRMIEVLKERCLYDNALIIYTADHGEYMGFHHLLLKGNYMYDPVVKVPLVVKFPRQQYAGTSTDALTSTVDVTSTILHQTGLQPSDDMRGQPLGPVCAGKNPGREYVVCEFTARNFVMVRSRRYKLLHADEPDQSLFFDLEADPLELKNLYHDSQHQSEVRRLKDMLLRWFQTKTEVHVSVQPMRRQIRQVSQKTAADMQRYIDRKMKEVLDSLARGASMYGTV